MKSLAERLPAEVAGLVHPDWRANESAYWARRDELLAQYRDQWIAYADGKVIATGIRPVEIFQAAQRSGRHPFVIRVGREEEPFRMRRASYAYDTTYHAEALPVLTAEFRVISGAPDLTFDRVIPDTGADASALPWADCQALQLEPSDGIPELMGGVGGSSVATLAFVVSNWLDGQEYPCQLQADFVGEERILGRDVLNRLEVLFRGPAGEVILNP